MSEDFSTTISAVPEGIRISCRVQPRASRAKIAGLYAGALKIMLTAPPVDGKANAALCEFFADLFSVPKSSVSVVLGMTSRTKTVQVNGITLSSALQALQSQNE